MAGVFYSGARCLSSWPISDNPSSEEPRCFHRSSMQLFTARRIDVHLLESRKYQSSRQSGRTFYSTSCNQWCRFRGLAGVIEFRSLAAAVVTVFDHCSFVSERRFTKRLLPGSIKPRTTDTSTLRYLEVAEFRDYLRRWKPWNGKWKLRTRLL